MFLINGVVSWHNYVAAVWPQDASNDLGSNGFVPASAGNARD